MAPYDDWNKIDEEDDEELQDYSVRGRPINRVSLIDRDGLQMFEGKRDVILFCIDCSESMQELYDHPNVEDTQTSNLALALEAAMKIEKQKIIAGPNDSIGIMLFNTVRRIPLSSPE